MNGYKTLIGAAVTFVAAMLARFGVDLGDTGAIVNALVILGGTALTVYGRFAATGPVGGKTTFDETPPNA